MVYVGDPHFSGDRWQNENCVIDPSAAVARSGADYAGVRMPYWPCYAEIDPASRRAYLEWLASGRDAPGAYIGYVFLYFYGLERRLFVDFPGDDEKRAIFDEVERLREIYGGNGSFDGYSKALLDCRLILLKDRNKIEPPLEKQRGWELPLPVKVGIGELIARGEPVSAEWLLSWWLAHPETRLRTPAKRAFKEFKELFLCRVRQRYPNGVEIKRPKANLSHRYRAASGTFEKEFDKELGHLPDVSRLKRPLAIADQIGAECMVALDSYSRYLGRNPDGRGSLEAHSLLPSEIRAAISNPALDALKEWTTVAKANGPLPVEELIEHVTGEAPERVTRSMLAKASNILAATGTGLAPDPAFAFIAPRRGDLVVLFDVGETEPPAEAEKKEYQAALLMLTLGALVAHADGRIDAAERQHLLDHIERARNLSDTYKARLRANLDWLLESPPELRTLKKHFAGLGADEKVMVGRLLIAIAGADGFINPSEVAIIEKIFDGLSLPTESLYSELHALSASSPPDEPVMVRPESPRKDGYAIPEPPDQGRNADERGILLDQSRIAAIMAETTKVSATLGAIFAEEEEHVDAGPDEARDLDEILLGPDPKHDALIRALLARSQWAAEEFAQLARQFELMPEGALEAINEWAFEVHEDLLIEGDQILEINVSVAERIGSMERGQHHEQTSHPTP
ncbi:MAG: TerB N-terminal domain-containing protein [Rhodothalassiaceae bacterium]